jgi:phosphoribosylformylglycinamidine synthase
MAGSRLPIAVSHGEGRARFDAPEHAGQAHVAVRYIEADGRVASRYPGQSQRLALGIAGLSSADGAVPC